MHPTTMAADRKVLWDTLIHPIPPEPPSSLDTINKGRKALNKNIRIITLKVNANMMLTRWRKDSGLQMREETAAAA